MNSNNVFNKRIKRHINKLINKQINKLHINFIKELIDKLKVNHPEELHTTMDDQLKTDMELIKIIIKNRNEENKDATNHFDCFTLFCAHKSKELGVFPDAFQGNLWKEWKELHLNGEGQYWLDMADRLNGITKQDYENFILKYL